MNIPVKTMDYISFNDIRKEMGLEYDDFLFPSDGDYADFCWIDITNARKEDLLEDIVDYGSESDEYNYVRKCENELRLINTLREQGITNGIEVFMGWRY